MKWKDFDVVVSEMFHPTDKKEGESLTFMVSHVDLRAGAQKAAILSFRVRPDVKPPTDTTNTNKPTTSVGSKSSFEVVEEKILKVFTAEDDGAKFRAYLVKWKNFDVVVSEMLGRTDKKEGELLTFMVSHVELPAGEQKNAILGFMVQPDSQKISK